MKRKQRQCPACLAMVSLSNFNRHLASVSCQNGGKGLTRPERYPWGSWRVEEDLYLLPCGYKGTKRNCTNKLITEALIARTGGNNFQDFNEAIRNGSKQVHNKGKATPVEQRLKISRGVKEYYEKNQVLAETRIKLSNNRKRYLKSHPEAHANVRVAGNRNKMTYPEKVAHDWFKRNGIEAPHNQRVGRYFPDFIVGNIIVEIDGEQWHSSDEQVARDKSRDLELAAMGYMVYRIPSKSRIENRLEELFL